MGGRPRYLAAALINDPERTVWQANDLIGADVRGPVVLLQVGRSSPLALELGRALQNQGRHTVSLVVRDRAAAQSEHTVARMAGACAVWVFAEDMLETFLTLYATDTADAGHTALLAEVELEVGDYARSARHFASVKDDADKPSIAARLARWSEVTGRLDKARAILRQSAARIANTSDGPREQLAWFHYRLGELHNLRRSV